MKLVKLVDLIGQSGTIHYSQLAIANYTQLHCTSLDTDFLSLIKANHVSYRVQIFFYLYCHLMLRFILSGLNSDLSQTPKHRFSAQTTTPFSTFLGLNIGLFIVRVLLVLQKRSFTLPAVGNCLINVFVIIVVIVRECSCYYYCCYDRRGRYC